MHVALNRNSAGDPLDRSSTDANGSPDCPMGIVNRSCGGMIGLQQDNSASHTQRHYSGKHVYSNSDSLYCGSGIVNRSCRIHERMSDICYSCDVYYIEHTNARVHIDLARDF